MEMLPTIIIIIFYYAWLMIYECLYVEIMTLPF